MVVSFVSYCRHRKFCAVVDVEDKLTSEMSFSFLGPLLVSV